MCFNLSLVRRHPEEKDERGGGELGKGGFGSVQKVLCHRIPLADKSIKVERQALERIKLESKHAEKLAGNNHFAKLVGTGNSSCG